MNDTPIILPKLTGSRLYQLLIPDYHRSYNCIVCSEKIKDHKYLRLSCPCLVKYHVKCFDQWFTKSHTCVSCRGECSIYRYSREKLRNISAGIESQKRFIMEDRILNRLHLSNAIKHHYKTKYERAKRLTNEREKYLEVLRLTSPQQKPRVCYRQKLKTVYEIDPFLGKSIENIAQ